MTCENMASKQEREVQIVKKDLLSDEQYEYTLFLINELSKLDHPNIIKIFDLYEDETYLYIVKERLSGSDLFGYVYKQQSFSELNAAGIVYQLLGALTHCHANKINMKCIKPDQLIFSDESSQNLKIKDFWSENTQNTTSLIYYAPETFTSKPTAKSDMWSLGVIIFIMLIG